VYLWGLKKSLFLLLFVFTIAETQLSMQMAVPRILIVVPVPINVPKGGEGTINSIHIYVPTSQFKEATIT
jgi:hypothetical protein